MASVALPAPAAAPAGVGRAMLIVAVMGATFMQVLDTTIANVALPHMQASLGATAESVNWVLTSYIVASAIAIPITGWLADRIGRRTLFVAATIAFTIASLLCAIATSLPEMVAFRIFQGIAGAFIVPLAQSVLFDLFPKDQHAKAMGLFAAGIMIGPILGPVLGGWLTERFDWRWVFLVNLPFGVVATLLLLRLMPKADPVRRRFDAVGFLLLALALGGLQMMLDRGEQLDWFDSVEVWLELGIAVSAAWMFAVHMATARDPIFDPAIFRDRNFVTGLLFMTLTGVMILAGLALLPPMLQRLFGYSVLETGFLTAPRGVGVLAAIAISGRLMGRVDARLLVLAGFALVAVSLWQMSGFSLQMDRTPVIVSGIVQGLGLGFVIVPLNTLAFGTLEARHRTTAASLLNLCRSLGGSVGISLAASLLARNLQVSHADLAAHVTDTAALQAVGPVLADPAGPAGATALALLDAEINRQAAMIAYIDDFHALMILCLAALPLVLLLRKARPAPAGESVVMD